MTSTTDLDALLVSALYGELSPAEQVRLDKHLVSHPQDRAALENYLAAEQRGVEGSYRAFEKSCRAN